VEWRSMMGVRNLAVQKALRWANEPTQTPESILLLRLSSAKVKNKSWIFFEQQSIIVLLFLMIHINPFDIMIITY
jgi:hypothetical protein